MDTKTLYQQSLAVISVQEQWSQHAYARDANGEDIGACDPTAVCWCSAGILKRFTPNYISYSGNDQSRSRRELNGALTEEAHIRGYRSYVELNDRMNHEYVISFWRHVGTKKGWND